MKTEDWAIGDRVWWRNSYGQSFSALVVAVLTDSVLVERPEWKRLGFGPEQLDLDVDNVILSRHFPASA